jgi:hypothetical protein
MNKYKIMNNKKKYHKSNKNKYLITYYRCVEPRDKNFAMGIIGSFLAIFGN